MEPRIPEALTELAEASFSALSPRAASHREPGSLRGGCPLLSTCQLATILLHVRTQQMTSQAPSSLLYVS